MKVFKVICFILTIVGAINWGLVGLLRFDLVAALFGEMSSFSRIIYSLVGFSGIYTLFSMYGSLIDEI